MRSSWLCLWVLFAGALLGPTASGQEVTSGEEGEEQPEVVEEPEQVVEEPEDVVEPELDSEEELEAYADAYRRHLEREHPMGWYSPIRHFKHMALEFMQLRGDDEYDPFGEHHGDYRTLEESSVVIKKAIGNIVKFRMIVTKGDCSVDEQVAHADYLRYLSFRPRPRPRPPTCKELDCVFTVYVDARTHQEAIINSECQPLLLANELMYENEEDLARRLGNDVLDVPDYEEATPAYDDATLNSRESDFSTSDEATPNSPSSRESDFSTSDETATYVPSSE